MSEVGYFKMPVFKISLLYNYFYVKIKLLKIPITTKLVIFI